MSFFCSLLSLSLLSRMDKYLLKRRDYYDYDYDNNDYDHILPDLARLMFELTPIDEHEPEILAALDKNYDDDDDNHNNNDQQQQQQQQLLLLRKKRVDLLRIVWYEGWIEKKGPFKWVQRAPKIWDHSSWLVFLKEFFFVRDNNYDNK